MVTFVSRLELRHGSTMLKLRCRDSRVCRKRRTRPLLLQDFNFGEDSMYKSKWKLKLAFFTPGPALSFYLKAVCDVRKSIDHGS